MWRNLVNCVTRIPTIISNTSNKINLLSSPKVINTQLCGIKISSVCNDIMEFFDEKKNWGEQTVKVGRAWNVEELRLKSNVDLHKLWFVLLKERNMLMTMEHEANELFKLFPNPERIDKVNISMKNLETVVRERNRAYHLLETGDTGERKRKMIKDEFGIQKWVIEREHLIPCYMVRSRFNRPTSASKKFMHKFLEQKRVERRRARNRDKNHVLGLLKRFPNMDKEHLQNTYPHLDIPKLSHDKKADGHFSRD